MPRGGPAGLQAVCAECDSVVCLAEPQPFYAVGLYYQDFAPVTDDQVKELLQEAFARRHKPTTGPPLQ